MRYELSFSQGFFTDETFPYETKLSEHATTVYQAIVSLPKEDKLAIAKILHSDNPEVYIQTESFDCDVLDKVMETNTCAQLSSPVDVYIDTEGFYSVLVYDKE